MIEKKVFKDSSLSNTMLLRMNEYRLSGSIFCDLTIETKDAVEYDVHKIVLSATCPYFENLFNSDDTIETCDKGDMCVLDFTSESFEIILNYLYTGEIEIDLSNAKEVLKDSTILCLNHLKNETVDFLKNNITNNSCLEFWRLANEFSCNELCVYCIEYISKNANDLFTASFFEQLTSDEILPLISRSSINCTEELICENVLSWIANDFENRKKEAMKLIEEIRFPNLSDEFMLSFVLKNDLLEKWPELSSLLVKIFEIKTKLINNKFVCNNMIIPRHIDTKVLFSIEDSIDAYYNGCWEQKKCLVNECNNSLSCTTFYENLLFIGGLGQQTNECKFYCPIKNKINDFPAFKNIRKDFRSIYLDDKIFVCGGYQNKSTEYFDLFKESWYNGPNFAGPRSNFGISSTEYCIYVVGGENKTIERLDVREGKWDKIATTPENFPKACIYQNYLYCINDETSGRIFDIRKSQWKDNLIPAIPNNLKKGAFDICLQGDGVYCLCHTYSPENTIYKSLFKYKNKYNGWRKVISSDNKCTTLTCPSIVSLYFSTKKEESDEEKSNGEEDEAEEDRRMGIR